MSGCERFNERDGCGDSFSVRETVWEKSWREHILRHFFSLACLRVARFCVFVCVRLTHVTDVMCVDVLCVVTFCDGCSQYSRSSFFIDSVLHLVLMWQVFVILDEYFLAGEVMETSKTQVLSHLLSFSFFYLHVQNRDEENSR